MTETKEEVTLEKLPIHVLRSSLKEKGIKFKTTDKKVDLIKMLRLGETTHKPREIKRAPQLEDSKGEKSLPIVPKAIRENLEALAKKGLKWDIDEEHGCINFSHGPLTSCANLDQSARNILNTAQGLFNCVGPAEKGRGDQRLEWA